MTTPGANPSIWDSKTLDPSAILLTETGPSWESELRYDGKSGLLTAVRMTQQDAIGMNVTELALTQ